MLWRIKDFKGVIAAEIDIRPGKSTVLTGVNSSGKSSIIQSLLLVAQSLQNENKVALNGPLVRLGDAQDLVREGSERGVIEIALGLEESEVTLGSRDPALRATFDLGPADDRSSLRVRRLKIGSQTDEQHSFEMGRENSRATDVALAMKATSSMGAGDVLHLKSLLDSERRQLRTYVAVQGLRPVAIVQLMEPEAIATRYRALAEVLLQARSSDHGRSSNILLGAAAFIREFLRLISESDYPDRKTLRDSRFGNPFTFESSWLELDPRQREELVDAAVHARAKKPYVVLPIRHFYRGYSSGAGLLESELATRLEPTHEALNVLSATLDSVGGRVQYLGPLRDEPRVVWNHWNELARGLPVGTRGEYSAAVLSRSSASPVAYAPPGQPVQVASLAEAVNEWLAYLEIGDAVAARSHGKLGVGIDLRVNGQVRDLTSVGVGVSQALPLVVGLLTAPLNSIFIVEQPELHLHPAVQARLADFVLSARPDLTVIVETHSESFVTRIRRRAAEGSVSTDNVDITFVEQGPNGSTARVLQVSEFGDLSDWPDGFLSAAEDDIRAIIHANIKRSSEAAIAD